MYKIEYSKCKKIIWICCCIEYKRGWGIIVRWVREGLHYNYKISNRVNNKIMLKCTSDSYIIGKLCIKIE